MEWLRRVLRTWRMGRHSHRVVDPEPMAKTGYSVDYFGECRCGAHVKVSFTSTVGKAQ